MKGGSHLGAKLASILLFIAAPLSMVGYPIAWWPILILFVLAILMWRWYGGWLVIVPAALPLLDFSPLTGRIFWSEFDTLLLLALAIGYLKMHKVQAMASMGRILLGAYAISVIASLVIGLFPLAPIDLNAFTHYTSHYNALRAAKGFLFALAFWPLIKMEWQDDAFRAGRRLAFGMTLGLVYELGYIVWERVTFSGLWNFDTDYRITGSFPGMNIGGASIETYLIMTAPFALLWAFQRRQVLVTLIAGGLYVLTAYGVMVTFSRGGQFAFVISTFLAIAGFTRLIWINRFRVIAGSSAILITAVMVVLVAWPIVSGKFSQARLATVHADIDTREVHWLDVLQILGLAGNSLIGAGLGSFPEDYYWYSLASTRPATYTFVKEDGNVFLRLGGGESLYFEQIVPVKPEHEYHLLVDLRAKDKASLTIPLCEKALLYSFACVWNTLKYDSRNDHWRHYDLKVKTRNFGPPGSLFRRPVKLSMFNQTAGSFIDVDNLFLFDEDGRNLLRNGDFSRGMEYWNFSTDSHLAWHEKNLLLHVFFEQGWIGLTTFVALLVFVLVTLVRRGRDPLSLTLLVSLTAFLIVGFVDSLIDEPRLDFLLFWLLSIAIISSARTGMSHAQVHNYHPSGGEAARIHERTAETRGVQD